MWVPDSEKSHTSAADRVTNILADANIYKAGGYIISLIRELAEIFVKKDGTNYIISQLWYIRGIC